ncbi:MAG TPA: SCO family protein [Chitinophagaceae bacterium]|nr:SCO family protein [Chitinophagaceae bacterium]
MSQQNSNKKFFIGLTVALLLPFSFYIIAKMLGKDKLGMPPYYQAERIDSAVVNGKMHYDTSFHQVNDIVLFNQMGDQVSLNKDLAGKMLVVEVFFTRCGTICPRLTSNMGILQKAFRKNDTAIHLVSITIDPENDTVQALRAYADRYAANPDRWWFLTGNRTPIENYLRNELKLMVKPSDGGAEELDHTQTIVLLDKERYIRGYYDGLDTAALKQCADDIGLLSMQRKREPRK